MAELEVDLDALVANWRLVAGRVAPAEAAAVVKADPYGLGAAAAAAALARAGCRRFFVATVDEGVALRRVLADAAIFVLNGVPEDADVARLRGARLLPVLAEAGQMRRWAAGGGPAPAAVQVDVGMTRLGVSPDGLAALMADPAWPAIEPVLLIGHLSVSEDAADPRNAAQRAVFERAAALLPGVPRSLAASGGAFLDDSFHYDVVRPGIALWGGNPTLWPASPVAGVCRLTAVVLQVRELAEAAEVGYGGTHTVAAGGRIATVALGYADGYPRALGGRGHMGFRGHRLPVVGRVSMDLTTLDAGALPAGALQPGDRVEAIGPTVPLDEVARAAGTIPYEILTRITSRVARRHRGG